MSDGPLEKILQEGGGEVQKKCSCKGKSYEKKKDHTRLVTLKIFQRWRKKKFNMQAPPHDNTDGPSLTIQ